MVWARWHPGRDPASGSPHPGHVWLMLVLKPRGSRSASSLVLAWMLAGRGVEAGTGWGGRGVRTHSMVFQITELYCQSTVDPAGMGWSSHDKH